MWKSKVKTKAENTTLRWRNNLLLKLEVQARINPYYLLKTTLISVSWKESPGTLTAQHELLKCHWVNNRFWVHFWDQNPAPLVCVYWISPSLFENDSFGGSLEGLKPWCLHKPGLLEKSLAFFLRFLWTYFIFLECCQCPYANFFLWFPPTRTCL